MSFLVTGNVYLCTNYPYVNSTCMPPSAYVAGSHMFQAISEGSGYAWIAYFPQPTPHETCNEVLFPELGSNGQMPLLGSYPMNQIVLFLNICDN